MVLPSLHTHASSMQNLIYILLTRLLVQIGAQGCGCTAANCECGPSAAVELPSDCTARLQCGPAPQPSQVCDCD